jgi:cyanophycin synthetase
MITLYDKRRAHAAAVDAPHPATLEGKALHNVQNAMFAAAMAHAMGVKLEDIRQGLRTFDTTFFQAPGRMNVFDNLPFKVILDYGHNPAAMKAMGDWCGASTCRAAASACCRRPATGATRTSRDRAHGARGG